MDSSIPPVVEPSLAERAPRRWLPWVVGGSLGCLLIFALASVSLYALVRTARSSYARASGVATAFVTAVGAGDDARALSLVAPEWNSSVPTESFRNWCESWRKTIGAVRSSHVYDTAWNSGPQGATTTLTMGVEGERGAGDVKVVLAARSGAIQVRSCTVSPPR